MDIPKNDTPTQQLVSQGLVKGVDLGAIEDCMQLLRVSKTLLNYFLNEFKQHSLTPGTYSILLELLSGAALSPSELAKKIGVSRPAATGLVDSLIEQELVQRREDDLDRRRLAIELSKKGHEFILSRFPEILARMSDLTTPLSNTRRKHLRDALEQIETILIDKEG